MDILANYGTVLIIVAAAFGFMMAIGIGANDVANAMGTSVGSKALTVKQAIIIAMIFEFAGAYLAGGEVTDTIRKGVIETSLFAHQPDVLVFGMMSALLAAGTWLLLASYMGWPVSTTHSIIGAIIGFACVSVGTEAVDWSSVQGIVGKLDHYTTDLWFLRLRHFRQRTTPDFRYRKTIDERQAFRTCVHVYYHYGDCTGYHQERAKTRWSTPEQHRSVVLVCRCFWPCYARRLPLHPEEIR